MAADWLATIPFFMCVQFENPLFAYCVETGKTGAIPLRNPCGKTWCQMGITLAGNWRKGNIENVANGM